MDHAPRRQRLTLPIAPLAAALAGMLLALLFALLPASVLEGWAIDSGLAAVVPAAAPPLGATARGALIVLGAGGSAALVWAALLLLVGHRAVAINLPRKATGNVPILRRADAHPDAPRREPVFAHRDLGTPFLEVRAVPDAAAAALPVDSAIPADLDLPLAALDPAAIPDEPAAWHSAPPSLVRKQVFDPGDRLETFELTPMVRPPRPRAEDDPGASIHALLDRLEQGVGRRETTVRPRANADTIGEALLSLRRLAAR